MNRSRFVKLGLRLTLLSMVAMLLVLKACVGQEDVVEPEAPPEAQMVNEEPVQVLVEAPEGNEEEDESIQDFEAEESADPASGLEIPVAPPVMDMRMKRATTNGRTMNKAWKLQLKEARHHPLALSTAPAGAAESWSRSSGSGAGSLGAGKFHIGSGMGGGGFARGPGLAGDFNTEEYSHISENEFKGAVDNPLSTFSIDVDTGSYSNVRRFINAGSNPPADAVRIEELINYFSYDYEHPAGDVPFAIETEISTCPWNQSHRLVLIGLQGKQVATDELPPSNLTFLIDVSGSMRPANKLPLLRAGLKLLVKNLREEDRVAIVVYAGAAGLVLPSTTGANRAKILEAIESLGAGGSTAGGAGIKLAYKVAKENFLAGGNNRVILATDGDFNIGVSSTGELTRLIEKRREDGVFLTVLGFGGGNYKGSRMEQLADKGNGNYAYIDNILEAKKVLVTEMGGTLFTIAKDVKIQVEFNPTRVKEYRLVGYENRVLAKEDFDDDTKDAGELGAGHTVTALYEVVPQAGEVAGEDELMYAKTVVKPEAYESNEIMTVKLRYKAPDGEKSKQIVEPVIDDNIPLGQTSDNLRFAAAVAQFGMLLRDSKFKADSSWSEVEKLAQGAKGKDDHGYRAEFIRLVERAELLSTTND